MVAGRGLLPTAHDLGITDANGDELGDLQGIRSRLPYLGQLGIDTV